MTISSRASARNIVSLITAVKKYAPEKLDYVLESLDILDLHHGIILYEDVVELAKTAKADSRIASEACTDEERKDSIVWSLSFRDIGFVLRRMQAREYADDENITRISEALSDELIEAVRYDLDDHLNWFHVSQDAKKKSVHGSGDTDFTDS